MTSESIIEFDVRQIAEDNFLIEIPNNENPRVSSINFNLFNRIDSNQQNNNSKIDMVNFISTSVSTK